MISATSSLDGSALTLNATVSGLAIYLDNFAMIDFASRDRSRRQRFILALQSRGDLLFSVSNAVDLTGPQGKSLEAVRAFLDEVGPHWVPVELNPFEVAERERNGAPPSQSCLSERFMKDSFVALIREYSPNSGRVINLSSNFFRLSVVLDWVVLQRESIRKGLVDLDEALVKRISGHRENFERDPRWLDREFPELPFNPSRPAAFTYVNLVRTLILDAKARRLKKGDGLDFCHAFMAGAFASIAALDKAWKRRVESFPKPNKAPRIYYGPELDKMVSDLESL